MLAETSALLASLATIKDLGSALFRERDQQKQAAIQIDLSDKVIHAQAQLSQVLAAVIDKDQTIQTLRDQVRALESAQNERDRYALHRLGDGSEGDYFVYKLRAPADLKERADEPAHFVCQTCFDAGKKSVLVHNGEGYWFCHLCSNGWQVSPRASVGSQTHDPYGRF